MEENKENTPQPETNLKKSKKTTKAMDLQENEMQEETTENVVAKEEKVEEKAVGIYKLFDVMKMDLGTQ